MALLTDQPCPYCHGTGKVKNPEGVEEPCPWCMGTTRQRKVWTSGDDMIDNLIFLHLQEVDRASRTLKLVGANPRALQDLVSAATFWFKQLKTLPEEVRNNNLQILWAMSHTLSASEPELGVWLRRMMESFCEINKITFKGSIQENDGHGSQAQPGSD